MIALDTTFIIDFLRGDKSAVAKSIELQNEQFAVTPINIFEVLLGIHLSKKNALEYPAAQEFFKNTEFLPTTIKASEQSARIEAELCKIGKMMETTDVLIAGTCITHGCTKILTRDKSFSKVKGIEAIRY